MGMLSNHEQGDGEAWPALAPSPAAEARVQEPEARIAELEAALGREPGFPG